ncbi:MAG: DUF4143 domain-containing protein [Spirochaetales bacterium]|nr:DUF4143 domain-containing protein [Spirochaetales bacterium]
MRKLVGFIGFLDASGMSRLVEYVGNHDVIECLRSDVLLQLQCALRDYLVVGGLPEAVNIWLKTKNYRKVDAFLDATLESMYGELDVSYPDAKALWNETASQLARENSRFRRLRPRRPVPAWLVEQLLNHLVHTGSATKVHRLDSPNEHYENFILQSQFKIYPLDTGLFRRMARLGPEAVLEDVPQLSRFRGTVTESYVLRELLFLNVPIFYWKDGNTAEVDFIADFHGKLLPIEVKTSTNVKSHSLALYRQQYHPPIALRYSMLNLKHDDDLLNIPLPMLHFTNQLLHTDGMNQ